MLRRRARQVMTSQDGRNGEGGREKHNGKGLEKNTRNQHLPQNTNQRQGSSRLNCVTALSTACSSEAKQFLALRHPQVNEECFWCTLYQEVNRAVFQHKKEAHVWYTSTRMQDEHGKATFKAKLTLGVSVHRLRRFGPAARPLPFGRRGLAIAVAHALSRTPRYFPSLDTM